MNIHELGGFCYEKTTSGSVKGMGTCAALRAVPHALRCRLDEEEEQRIKLRVRDAVLSFLSPELEAVRDKAEAERIVSASLPQIKAAAESAAEGRHVTVTLEREHYPSRRYGSFALPAGEYESLRVILGKGEGHNWWCVVFPPVCLGAGSEEALEEAVGDETFQILCSGGHTALRFKLLELWGNLTR